MKSIFYLGIALSLFALTSCTKKLNMPYENTRPFFDSLVQETTGAGLKAFIEDQSKPELADYNIYELRIGEITKSVPDGRTEYECGLSVTEMKHKLNHLVFNISKRNDTSKKFFKLLMNKIVNNTENWDEVYQKSIEAIPMQQVNSQPLIGPLANFIKNGKYSVYSLEDGGIIDLTLFKE